jgi:hypothetical protein
MVLPCYFLLHLQKHNTNFLPKPVRQTLVGTSINGDGNFWLVGTFEKCPVSSTYSLGIVSPTQQHSEFIIIIPFNIIFLVVTTHIWTQLKQGLNHAVIGIFNTSNERIRIFSLFIIYDDDLAASSCNVLLESFYINGILIKKRSSTIIV